MMSAAGRWRARVVSVSAALLVAVLAVTLQAQSPTAFERAWQSGAPTTITGQLTELFADDFARGRSELMHVIRDSRSGRSFRIHLDREAPAHWRSGRTVTVSGRANGSELYVLAASTDPNATSSTSPSSGTPTPTVVGDQKTLVMVANFTDANVSCSVNDINNIMFADPNGVTVDNLYREVSRGQVSFSGQVVGPFAIAASSTDTCDISRWATAVEAEAVASGVDLSAYPRRMYVMPPANTCPGAGFGTVGGSPSGAWIFACSVRGLYAHEVGHNLGMDHASTPASEYGDTTDPMAFGSSQLRGTNAPHRQQLGWLGAGTTESISQDGFYDIAPLAADPSTATAPQVVTIAKPDTGEFYYLSFRDAIGFDNGVDGVYLDRLSVHRYKGDGSASKTWLLAALADSESFVDSTNGITVSMVSHGPAGATARVEFSPTSTCVPGAPTLTLSPATQSGTPGASLSYGVSVTNRDSLSCGASTFGLARAVPTGWSGLVSPASVTLYPAATAYATLTVTSPAGALGATYNASVTTGDAASAAHGVSASVSYAVIAPCVPSAPTASASPASRTGSSGSTVTYTVSVANHDSATCGASTFQVNGTWSAGWSGAASPSTVALAPGQSSSVTIAVTSPTGAAAGTYPVAANVTDVAQAQRAGSAAMTYSVQTPPDSTPPSAPTGLAASANQKLKQIRLTWTASNDNVGVSGYRVFRNGFLAGTSSTTDWTDTTWVTGATNTYVVLAYDAAGNVSAASNSVSVTLGGSGGGGKRK